MVVKKSRLHECYLKDAVKFLQEKFNYKNAMQIPKLLKIVVSSSIKQESNDEKEVVNELFLITGQRPVVSRAKKSIAGFKLRQNMPVGCFVTLRGDRMYYFLDRFINVALPRVRDFRGISSKQFDGCGNFAFGLKEQIVFPEINYDKIDRVRGMNIAIVTTAKTNQEAKALLQVFNMPFTR